MGFVAALTAIINAFFQKRAIGLTAVAMTQQALPTMVMGERAREIPLETTQLPQTTNYHPVTLIRNVTANFYSKGAAAWVNQPGGQHYGTDFSAPPGTPVYLPFDGTIIKKGEYTDTGRLGAYIMFTLADGAELYLGHLNNLIALPVGTNVKAGTIVGVTNKYAHTHVQLRISGQLADYEDYERNRIKR